MKKYYIILLMLAGLSACTSADKPTAEIKETATKTPDSLKIAPGERVGDIHLGDDMEVLINKFGKPDESDAAMGSAAYTWYAGHIATGYATVVYGHRNFGGADESVLHAKKILITSPDYVTADGINTGASRSTITQHYQLADSTRYTVNGKGVHVFADIKKGIAFDIDSLKQTCTAISIFKPGDTSAVYINLH